MVSDPISGVVDVDVDMSMSLRVVGRSRCDRGNVAVVSSYQQPVSVPQDHPIVVAVGRTCHVVDVVHVC